MVHAEIIDSGAEGHSEQDEAFAGGADELSCADRDYYHRRAAQEAKAACFAACPEAQMAHAELAKTYRRLCGPRAVGDKE